VTIKEQALKMATAIELTSDDSRTFEIRGSFGQQLTPCVSANMFLVHHDVRVIQGRKGKLSFTDLFFQQEDDEKKRAKCTLAFDAQNIFLATDPKTSLKKLGEGSDGADILKMLASFKVESIVPTGLYPMKYSLAAMQCGFAIGHEYSEADMSKLRSQYRANDGANKVARPDATDDIGWLEIQHVHISPLA